MTDINQIFAIVPVNGKPPDDAICWGTLGECTEFVAQSVARVAVEQRIAEAKEQIQTDAKCIGYLVHIENRGIRYKKPTRTTTS